MTARADPPFRPVVAALAFVLLAAVRIAFAAPTLMHGYADYTSALLWIQAERPGSVQVAWRSDGDAAERTLELDAREERQNVVVARLTGLAPGATVRYRVRADGSEREGELRAQSYSPREPADVTIALGSCFFLADDDPRWNAPGYGSGYEIFDAIAARKPDLMLWLGDNLYFQTPDFLDPAALAARHRRQRTFAPLQRLLTATSHLAIWDDHDFGPNDSDGSYTMKGETLALFKRYWPNPSFGLPDVPGVFGVARIGEVEIFLLDDRYHRSPDRAKDGPGKTMLGAAQLAWLEAALTSSKAPIKLIAIGGQSLKRTSRYEGWHQFPTEKAGFLDFLLEQRIEGVVFVSGDRHFGELLRVERPGAYPLYELTSSPLTSKPFEIPASERDDPELVPGTQAAKRQFGLLRVTGPRADRRIVFASYDQHGEELWRHEIRVGDLRFPRQRR